MFCRGPHRSWFSIFLSVQSTKHEIPRIPKKTNHTGKRRTSTTMSSVQPPKPLQPKDRILRCPPQSCLDSNHHQSQNQHPVFHWSTQNQEKILSSTGTHLWWAVPLLRLLAEPCASAAHKAVAQKTGTKMKPQVET